MDELRRLLATYPLPWKLDESFTDSGRRYVAVESSATFEDIAGQYGIDQDAAELIVAAVNALPKLLAIAEAYNAGESFTAVECEHITGCEVRIPLPLGQTVRLVRVVGE